MWLCGSPRCFAHFAGVCGVFADTLVAAGREDGSSAAQPAWHTLSSGKSTLFHKEQVGEKAQYCRAHRAAVRGGIPLKRISTALKINSSLK